MEKNKKIAIIVIGILLVILLVYLYFYDFKHINLYKGYDLFYEDKVVYVGSENMKESDEGIQYSFSIWLRTNNLPGNSIWNTKDDIPKTIVYNNGSPNILYLRKENSIRIEIAYNENDYYNFDLEDFETQIWSNIIVTVDNKNINIYKNGLLEKSKIINNSNLKNYKMMSIGENGNNFNGYIGNIDYYSYILKPNKILKLYLKNKNKYPNNLMNYEQYVFLDKKKKEKEKIQLSTDIKNFII